MSYIDDEELKIDVSDDEEYEKGLGEDLNEPGDDDDLVDDDDLLASEIAGLDGSLY